MNEQELQMVERLFTMLESAGDGAYWLAVLWLGTDYFVVFCLLAGFVMSFILVPHAFGRFNSAVSLANEARRTARLDDPYGQVIPEERIRVLNLIEKGLQKEEENKLGLAKAARAGKR